MAVKNIYELNNIAIGDPSKVNQYLIAPEEGATEFRTKTNYRIPKDIVGFSTIVVDEATKRVGKTPLDDVDV